jgi:hypothetical protein
MNHARLPKEILLPDWARRDMQGTKGDLVYHVTETAMFIDINW